MKFERQRRPECLSDCALDRFLAAREKGEAASPHLAECDACKARLWVLEGQRVDFLVSGPSFEPGVTPIRARSTALRNRWALMGGALAVAAAVFLVVTLRGSEQGALVSATRSKGGAVSLFYYVQRDGESNLASENEILRPGETIRFAYSSSQSSYLLIVGIDRDGTTSVYYDDSGKAAVIGSGVLVPLAESVVLDSSLGIEEIHAFFCDAPLATPQATSATRKSQQPLLEGCSVASLQWEKQAQ